MDIVIKKVLRHDGVLDLSLGGSPGVTLARWNRVNNEFVLEFVWPKKKSSVTAEDSFDMRQCLMSSVFLVSVIIKFIHSFNENCKMDLFPGTSLLLKYISFLFCISASSSATTSVYNFRAG